MDETSPEASWFAVSIVLMLRLNERGELEALLGAVLRTGDESIFESD